MSYVWLDEILVKLTKKARRNIPMIVDHEQDWFKHNDTAKQAIIDHIEKARPGKFADDIDRAPDSYGAGYNQAIDEYTNNLRKGE